VSAPGPATAGGPLAAAAAGTGTAAVSVRRAVPADREDLALMFGRCTAATRQRRFHGSVRVIPERYLAEALSGGPFHYALVACAEPGGGIVALASCRLVAEGAAELGVLVEDAWQRRGLGTRLLGGLVAHARRAGVRALEAQLLAEQGWVTGLLRPYGRCRLRSSWSGVLSVTVRLDP
jgi:GNAT superfamily N-acetyltransferase